MMESLSLTAAISKNILQPTHPIHATWSRIPLSSFSLPLSSHTISIISGRAYIFGGELKPREPVSNDMHVITLPSSSVSGADYKSLPAASSNGLDDVPEKRVGHSAAVIGQRIFVFGGRGGGDMKPLDEQGALWVFDTREETWRKLEPAEGSPVPCARSYHASVGIERPPPARTNSLDKNMEINPATEEPSAGTIANATVDYEGEGYGTVIVHAGCKADGGRLNDVWAFDVRTRMWSELPEASGKGRGGVGLTASKQRLYRFGGFSGEDEERGQIDVLELGLATFSDKGGDGTVGVTGRTGKWESIPFHEGATETEKEGEEEHNSLKESVHAKFPGNRSVAALQTITTGQGREYLVLIMGKREPSTGGHAAAGKFWDDVWTFQVPPVGGTGASWKDAMWQAVGRRTGEKEWSEVNVSDAEGQEGEDIRDLTPQPRGWFASASLGELDPAAVAIWGGINEENQRLGDGWILRVE